METGDYNDIKQEIENKRKRNRDRMRKWRAEFPEEYKVQVNKQYARIAAEQEERAGMAKPDRCNVCNRIGRVAFDHCHKTNTFRGWLCQPCNVILGFCQDDPAILRKLADYLER